MFRAERTLILLASAAVGVCSATAQAAVSPNALPPATASPAHADPAHEGECPAGSQLSLAGLVGAALGNLQLRPDQTTAVEKIGRELDQAERPAERAQDDLLESIAEQLEQGKVDRAELTPWINALVIVRLRERPTLEKLVVALHDLLDSQQRTQFVDTMEAELKAALAATASERIRGLGLTNQQLADVRALGSAQGVTVSRVPRIFRVLEAFRGDSLNLEAIVPSRDEATNARKRAAALLNIVEGITRILTPEQRVLLAGTLRAGVECAEEDTEPEATATARAQLATPRYDQETGPGAEIGPGYESAERESPPVFHRGFFAGFHAGFPAVQPGGAPTSGADAFAPFDPNAPFTGVSPSASNLDIALTMYELTSGLAFF
jgi:Spy/CpxP family protein refolding chaperone